MMNYDKGRVILTTIAGSLGLFFWGYTNCIPSALIPYFQQYHFKGLSPSQISLITSTIPLGAILSVNIASYIASKHGRRKALLIGDILAVLGVLFTLVNNFYTIVIGRLLHGFVVGLNSSIGALYLIETSPKHIRGVTGPVSVMAMNLGILLAYFVGFYVPMDPNTAASSNIWRTVFFLAIIPPVVRILIFKTILRNETPTFLVLHGRESEARQALSEFLREGVDETLKELIRDRDIQSSKKEDVKFKDLFTLKFINVLIVGILVGISYHLCGMNVLFTFPNILFGEGTNSESEIANMLTFIMGMLNFLSKFLALYVIQKRGRRDALIQGLIYMTLILFLYWGIASITSTANIIAKILLVLWCIPFSVSVGTMVFLYFGEILPTVGISVCVQLVWIWGFLVSQSFLQMKESIGLAKIFLIFACICGVITIYLYFYAVESKGKSKGDITLEFQKKGPFIYTDQEDTMTEMEEKFLKTRVQP